MKLSKEQVLDELQKGGFHVARMLSGSKSYYSSKYPNNVVFFNANMVDEKIGKVWYGDLDLTVDSKKIIKIAKKLKTTFYILSERDGRFENESKSARKLIKKSKWNTNQFVPVYDCDYEMCPVGGPIKIESKIDKNAKKLDKKWLKSGVIQEEGMIVAYGDNLPKILKNVTSKFNTKKIELAATDGTDQYQREIGVILRILGHPGALVTDESSIWDFLSHFGDKKENEKFNKKLLAKISGRLGFEVTSKDLLIEVAQKTTEFEF